VPYRYWLERANIKTHYIKTINNTAIQDNSSQYPCGKAGKDKKSKIKGE
jgi:hypothetical protein